MHTSQYGRLKIVAETVGLGSVPRWQVRCPCCDTLLSVGATDEEDASDVACLVYRWTYVMNVGWVCKLCEQQVRSNLDKYHLDDCDKVS